MNSQKNLEEIDNYLFDLMSQEDKEAFELRLKEDKELRVEFSINHDIMIAIKHRDTFEFVAMAMKHLESRKLGLVGKLAEILKNGIKKGRIEEY